MNEQIAKGVRLKDMPEEWFALPDEEGMQNSLIAVLIIVISKAARPRLPRPIKPILTTSSGLTAKSMRGYEFTCYIAWYIFAKLNNILNNQHMKKRPGPSQEPAVPNIYVITRRSEKCLLERISNRERKRIGHRRFRYRQHIRKIKAHTIETATQAK